MSRSKEEILAQSFAQSREGHHELVMYSLRKMAEPHVKENYHTLTNLPNLKALFYLGDEMTMENPEREFAVIILDIAQFKAVNEFCGRVGGDALLMYIAGLLDKISQERELTIACHMRADVFILYTAFEEEQELVDIVEKLKDDIEKYEIACKIMLAFGICTSVKNGRAVSYLKDCATTALNTIKGKFYTSYAFFDDNMRREQMRKQQIENDVLPAMRNDEFKLFIQPKVDMNTGEIIGGECLVRWLTPMGMCSPGDFIPVLERDGFIINLDTYIWEKAFAFLAELRKEGVRQVPLSMNVSRVHAYDDGFMDKLFELSDVYKIEPSMVTLELTESAFLGDESLMYERMKRLQDKGFKISIDDFGTGYSNMKMLKTDFVDEIKVDRSFIMDIECERSKIVVKHTLELLHAVGVDVVIEGVESKEQEEFLLSCGCKSAQGFRYYRPMLCSDFKALL